MNRREQELFLALCSFKKADKQKIRGMLEEYGTPEVLGQLFCNRMQAVAYGVIKDSGALNLADREFRNALAAAYEQNVSKNKPSNATNPSVKWSSSNPSVVSINANSGKIYGKSAGTATIYATAQDGSGRKDCCTVVVSQKILVSAIQLNKNNFTLQVGSRYTLSAIVSVI